MQSCVFSECSVASAVASATLPRCFRRCRNKCFHTLSNTLPTRGILKPAKWQKRPLEKQTFSEDKLSWRSRIKRPSQTDQNFHWPSPAVELRCRPSPQLLSLWYLPNLQVKGGKRKGAKATKSTERLLSKGHVLEPDEATAFRALSARGNYLAADRPDIGYSAKELCCEFAQPNRNSFELQRMARCLNSHRRLVYKYAWGDPQTVHSPSGEILDVYVDTVFAGCGQSRRSTSGGIIMYNGHSVKHYSVIQSTLCHSRGES